MPAQTTARFVNKVAHGFCNVVEVPAGRLVFVTGQMSVDEKFELQHPGDFAGQVERTFANVAAQLDAVGATFHDVVKIEMLAVEETFLAGITTSPRCVTVTSTSRTRRPVASCSSTSSSTPARSSTSPSPLSFRAEAERHRAAGPVHADVAPAAGGRLADRRSSQ